MQTADDCDDFKKHKIELKQFLQFYISTVTKTPIQRLSHPHHQTFLPNHPLPSWAHQRCQDYHTAYKPLKKALPLIVINNTASKRNTTKSNIELEE